MKKIRKLPNKPSDLLLAAVSDCRELQKSPKKFTLDMGLWLTKKSIVDGKCHVCMAGALMDRRLCIETDINSIYDVSDERNINKLMAVNYMRGGAFDVALERLGYQTVSPKILSAVRQAILHVRRGYDYNKDRARWSDYEKAAKELRKVNL